MLQKKIKLLLIVNLGKRTLKTILSTLRGYHTLQGDNSLKSVERFVDMMFVCRFQASR